MRFIRTGTAVLVALALIAGSGQAARADLSAFVANINFDKDANLGSGQGFGLRWGKSSSIIGGETSLTLAFPDRKLLIAGEIEEETATALIYEARILLNIPLGTAVSPFVGAGFGAVTVTSTDVPQGADTAIKALGETQTNSAFSWGGGLRYGLSDRLDLRADFRQFVVFSVTGVALRAAAAEAGVPLEEKDNTVKHNKISLGVSVKF